jgi:hypothetical protein
MDYSIADQDVLVGHRSQVGRRGRSTVSTVSGSRGGITKKKNVPAKRASAATSRSRIDSDAGDGGEAEGDDKMNYFKANYPDTWYQVLSIAREIVRIYCWEIPFRAMSEQDAHLWLNEAVNYYLENNPAPPQLGKLKFQ